MAEMVDILSEYNNAMKYLFFDIECSNCFNGVGKMCEFGYVLTDEKFNVIRKDDIPMSPGKGDGNRFHLKGRKHEKDLELAYDYDFYYSCPEFPAFYSRIKNLMEESYTICFAYSMDNDIPHLYHSCTRYKLPPLNYNCYDVQKLVAAYLEKKGQMSLHNACLEIVGPHSTIKLQEHLSRDDAEMERMIFEAICILTKTDSEALLKQSSFAKTNSIEYMDRIINRSKEKGKKVKGFDIYKSVIATEDELNDPNNIGKRYNISVAIKKDPEKLEEVINYVKNINGLFAGNLIATDILIALDEENKNYLSTHIKGGVTAKMITYQELLNLETKNS